jgi:hypothetical protein
MAETHCSSKAEGALATVSLARPAVDNVANVARHPRFEAFRFVGDKRSLVVYDTDSDAPEVSTAVDAAFIANTAVAMSPDTVAEARNRGFRRVVR